VATPESTGNERIETVDGKRIVGWREYVGFPDWGITGVLAKVDTGARTSSLHVRNIVTLPNDRVRFDVVLSRKFPDRTITVTADLARHTNVRPSSGQRQQRRVVRTRMELGGVEREIEVSLVCRQGMLCRMLLGRRALEGDFVVDSSRRYVFGRPKRRRKKKKQA
jgi:hypothetical protein